MPTILLDTRATAKRLAIALPTLAKMRLSGGGPPYLRIGGKVLYDEADVERFIAERPRLKSTADLKARERRAGRAGRKKAAEKSAV